MRGNTTNKHSTASVLAATDKENATHVLELGPDGSPSSSSSISSAGSSGSMNRDGRAKRRRTDDAQGLLRVNTEHRRRKQASIARHGRRPDSIDDRDWARQQDTPTPRNSFTGGSATVSFQRRLARPRNLPTLSAGDLVACHPAYAGLDLNQIRTDLAARGPALAAALHSVRAAPTSTVPHTLDAVVASLDDLPAGSALPTHFFAVHAKFSAPSPTRTARRSVTLFPAHDIVFQAHCSKLTPIPAALNIPAEPAADGKSLNVTLPVVPLMLPSPKTFGLLQHYLYNQDVDSLATALLPGLSDIMVSGDEDRTQTVNLLARHMAARLGPAKINEHVLLAHGLWSNIAVLGISDDGLWTALDFFWDVLMHALHLATLMRPTEDLLLGPAPPALVATSTAPPPPTPSSASSSDSSSSGESDSESGHSDSTALTTPPASPVLSPCLHPSEPKLPDAVPTQMDTSC